MNSDLPVYTHNWGTRYVNYKDLYKKRYAFTFGDPTGIKFCELLDERGGGEYKITNNDTKLTNVHDLKHMIRTGRAHDLYIEHSTVKDFIKTYEEMGMLYLSVDVDYVKDMATKMRKMADDIAIIEQGFTKDTGLAVNTSFILGLVGLLRGTDLNKAMKVIMLALNECGCSEETKAMCLKKYSQNLNNASTSSRVSLNED